MSRTKYAIDKSKRKLRNDRGKKRKLYKGKPVKTKRQFKLEKQIGNKTTINLLIREKIPMSYDGLMRFPSWIRSKIHPFVYPFRIHFKDYPVSQISNRYLIEKLCEDNLWQGIFYIMGVSYSAKSKRKRKWVTMCVVEIRDTPEGLRAKIIQNRRLFRYKWFYKE